MVEDNETKKWIFKTNDLDEIMTPPNLRGEAGLRVFEVTPTTTIARDLSPTGNTVVLSSHKRNCDIKQTQLRFSICIGSDDIWNDIIKYHKCYIDFLSVLSLHIRSKLVHTSPLSSFKVAPDLVLCRGKHHAIATARTVEQFRLIEHCCRNDRWSSNIFQRN